MADKKGGNAPKPEEKTSDPQTAPAESKTRPQPEEKAEQAEPRAREKVKDEEKPAEGKKSGDKPAAEEKEKISPEGERDSGSPKGPSPEKIGDLRFFPEIRSDLPAVHPGDVINVAYLIQEGGKDKIQNYQGTVIGLKGAGISRTMTVRKISFGIGVERIFPLNSRYVQKIEIIRRSRVRRSKLYYLRKLRGKASRLKPLK